MYRAFGLTIDSDLALPELAEVKDGADGSRIADVIVRLHQGAAPARDVSAFWFDPEDFVFRVEAGRRIDIWAPRDAIREDISIWLLGTVMAALLHQRGHLTLHANCLLSDTKRTIAFAGDSGSGKSSLAAMAAAMGWGVLGDDLLAIEAGCIVNPGVLRLKLWRGDLRILGAEASGLRKVASDLDKYHVPLPSIEQAPRQLERLYLLAEGDLAFERLTGIAAADALLANLYRFGVGQEVRGESDVQFKQALALANTIDVWRFSRPRNRTAIESHFAALVAHLDS